MDASTDFSDLFITDMDFSVCIDKTVRHFTVAIRDASMMLKGASVAFESIMMRLYYTNNDDATMSKVCGQSLVLST